MKEHRGTHLSLSVSICCGEFDDQLKWPFNGEILVQAYNCSYCCWSNGPTIVMNKRECGIKYVERCIDKMSQGVYGQDFLPLSLIDEYLMGTNAIRFRVSNVVVMYISRRIENVLTHSIIYIEYEINNYFTVFFAVPMLH